MIRKLLSAGLAALLLVALAVPALAADDTKVTRLRMNRSEMDMVIGETRTLSVTVYPTGATDTIHWSAGNTRVAEVDQNGNVTAVDVGSTTISAKSSNDKVTRCTVTVYRKEKTEDVTRVDLFPGTLTVRVNQSRQLTSFITPISKDDEIMEWYSSDVDVADVDHEGLVTGVAPGTATITATSANGVTGSCTINVTGIKVGSIKEEVPNTTLPNEGELLSSAAVKTVVENTARHTAKGALGTAVLTDKSSLTPTVAGAAAYTADSLGKTVQLKFTTTNSDKKTQGFLILDPAKVTEATGAIGTLVSLDSSHAQSATSKFEKYYQGRLEVIDCTHRGAFGQQVTVGARADLSGMNTDNLSFSLYNRDTNTVTPLEAAYRIDDSGYLRITTTTGGIIIVSDGPLTKK